MNKDLRKQIKSERERRRVKAPFGRTLFARIGSLVSRNRLDDSFVRDLGFSPDEFALELSGLRSIKKKSLFEPSLFSLLTEKEYRVTTAIISTIDNPYLNFVNAPDEIFFCTLLFRQNPELEAERLARCHFETLLVYELALERTDAFSLKLEQLKRKAVDHAQNGGSVLSELALRMGFVYSPDGEIYLRNLREKVNSDSFEGGVSSYGISAAEIWGETLSERYAIGIRVAMNIIGRNLPAICESYRQELLEEDRLELDSVGRRLAELWGLISSIKGAVPELEG